MDGRLACQQQGRPAALRQRSKFDDSRARPGQVEGAIEVGAGDGIGNDFEGSDFAGLVVWAGQAMLGPRGQGNAGDHVQGQQATGVHLQQAIRLNPKINTSRRRPAQLHRVSLDSLGQDTGGLIFRHIIRL